MIYTLVLNTFQVDREKILELKEDYAPDYENVPYKNSLEKKPKYVDGKEMYEVYAVSCYLSKICIYPSVLGCLGTWHSAQKHSF